MSAVAVSRMFLTSVTVASGKAWGWLGASQADGTGGGGTSLKKAARSGRSPGSPAG